LVSATATATQAPDRSGIVAVGGSSPDGGGPAIPLLVGLAVTAIGVAGIRRTGLREPLYGGRSRGRDLD
jgi:hypothetical protein